MGNLVITRRPGQRFTLKTSDGEVEITVIEWTRLKAVLGIRAPASVQIERDDAIKIGLPTGGARP